MGFEMQPTEDALPIFPVQMMTRRGAPPLGDGGVRVALPPPPSASTYRPPPPLLGPPPSTNNDLLGAISMLYSPRPLGLQRRPERIGRHHSYCTAAAPRGATLARPPAALAGRPSLGSDEPTTKCGEDPYLVNIVTTLRGLLLDCCRPPPAASPPSHA
ncbi:hypothetical protein B0H14DRAFT_2603269 [Mycena olivaceomarginata]|nr:hypothetical protein B0H14DRAFT_2603269 [Mycena olivaceomarginata]